MVNRKGAIKKPRTLGNEVSGLDTRGVLCLHFSRGYRDSQGGKYEGR